MNQEFEKNGYIIARDFLDNTTLALAQTYFDMKYRFINYSNENRAAAEKSETKDPAFGVRGDIATSLTFYSDTLIESMHLNYGQKASNAVGMNLSPTYTFTRIYEKTNTLIPHVDRPSCEVSLSCPILISDDRPSTIYVSNYKFNVNESNSIINSYNEIEKRGDYSEINLYPGDALFYRGCERYHWRKPLESDYLIQFFMHFVETEGKNKEWYYDKRPYSGFPELRVS